MMSSLNVMMSSLKDTDVKVLRAEARRFLTELFDPALKGGVIDMLKMNFTQRNIRAIIIKKTGNP